MTASTSPATAWPNADQRPVSDRRARHRERRHTQVYSAAVELFIEQGFDNTTMEQIAERADVARATVFNHFPRKTAFLDEWTARRRKHAAAAVRKADIAAWSLSRILGQYMTEMARLSQKTRRETVELMTAAVHGIDLFSHPALADELVTFIIGAQRSGEASADLNVQQAAVLTAVSYFAVLTQWISEEPAPFDLRTELLAMINIVLHGIMRSDGRKS